MLNAKGLRQSFFFTVLTFLLIIAPFLLSCGGGSGGGGDDGGGNNSAVSETFTNAGLSLTAETTETETSRSVVVKDSEGDIVLTAEATTTEVTINFPGSNTPYIISLDKPLTDLPSAFEMNRMGTYIAGQLVDNASKAVYPMDLPGCDWFPDTLCTLGCCADHDQCFKENGCSVTSWFQIGASLECRECNDTVVACILRGCYYTGVSRDNDTCYDNECDTYYDCDGVSCECTSPCDQEICDNGVDDDGDTYTDCEDADCIENVACIEICDNGVDDDGDTLIDCQDADCANDDICKEECPIREGTCTMNEQSSGLTLTYWIQSPPPWGGPPIPYCNDDSGVLLTTVVGGLTTAEIISTGDWNENWNGWWDSQVLTCGYDVSAGGILICAEGVDCGQECETIEGTCSVSEQSPGLTLKYLLKAQPPYTGPAIPYCENDSETLFTDTPYGLRNAEVTNKGAWNEDWNGWWDSQVLTCGYDVPAGGVLTIVE